jgi:hypothetical protein
MQVTCSVCIFMRTAGRERGQSGGVGIVWISFGVRPGPLTGGLLFTVIGSVRDHYRNVFVSYTTEQAPQHDCAGPLLNATYSKEEYHGT